MATRGRRARSRGHLAGRTPPREVPYRVAICDKGANDNGEFGDGSNRETIVFPAKRQ